jgi:hypothetical protein
MTVGMSIEKTKLRKKIVAVTETRKDEDQLRRP